MDGNYKNYWKEVIDYNYKSQKNNYFVINLFDMLCCSGGDYNTYKQNNNYLLNESDYNILREKLPKANITFKNCNVVDLPQNSKNNYDFILLSNISDYLYREFGEYWGYNDLKKLANSLEKLLKKDGVLALAYIFGYSLKGKDQRLIYNSAIYSCDLNEEEILEVQGHSENYNDALIIRKKI